MPYSIRKSKCKQADGDPGSYVLSYTDNKGKGHSNCHTSRKKARAQIAAIEMPEGADLDEGWVPFAAMMAQDLEEQLAELAGAHRMVIDQVSLRRIVREELIREGVLKDIWNSKATDWSLTALGAAADAFPGAGTAVSIGIAQVQAVKAAAQADWLGVILALLAIFPVVGDSLGALGRAIRDGLSVGKPVLQAAAQALGNITTNEVIEKAKQLSPELAKHAPQIGKAFDDFKGDLSRRARA